MVKLEEAIVSLTDNEVDFVIVGGVAIKLHSSGYLTVDLDFCYSRSPSNILHVVAALSPFNPRPRDFPKELPYYFDERSLQNGTNFTFETSIGDIDLSGEVSGVGLYEDVVMRSEEFELYGRKVKVLDLNALIDAKRAAGRPKDLLVLPELEALREALDPDEE